jgi:hypothetical protein
LRFVLFVLRRLAGAALAAAVLARAATRSQLGARHPARVRTPDFRPKGDAPLGARHPLARAPVDARSPPASGAARDYQQYDFTLIRPARGFARRPGKEEAYMATDFERYTSNSSIARGINNILGIWLFISAFVWDHTMAERTNTWILGILCVAFAVTALWYSAARLLNTALAVWLFISVWALPHHDLATLWNNAIVAIVVFLLSLVPGDGEQPIATRRAPA